MQSCSGTKREMLVARQRKKEIARWRLSAPTQTVYPSHVMFAKGIALIRRMQTRELWKRREGTTWEEEKTGNRMVRNVRAIRKKRR